MGVHVGSRESLVREMSGQYVHKRTRDGQNPNPGGGLWGPGDGSPIGVTRHDLGDRHGSAEQIKAAHPKAGDLTPPESEQCRHPDHGLVALVHGSRQRGHVVR